MPVFILKISYLRLLESKINLRSWSTAENAEATYVSAAASKTFFAPFTSSSVRYPSEDKRDIALLLALNSTGKVTNVKITAKLKAKIPILSKGSKDNKSPTRKMGQDSIDPILTTG